MSTNLVRLYCIPVYAQFPTTDAIVNFSRPENAREDPRFLGLSGYFRKFIPTYSVGCKDEVFGWFDHQQKAFQELKDVLISETVFTLLMFELNINYIQIRVLSGWRQYLCNMLTERRNLQPSIADSPAQWRNACIVTN